MAKRHEYRLGDWEAIALRLDEIISAHSGEDPFEESFKLIVAKLMYERIGGRHGYFLAEEGEGVLTTLDALLARAAHEWRGVLDVGSRCQLNLTELRRCGDLLRDVALLQGELVGLDAVFEFIVNKASKGQKGQYFTPRYVVDEITTMMAPQTGERVADPACGSGAFLRHAIASEPGCTVFGFDQDYRAIRVARMMLAASDQPPWRVMRVDSLHRPGALPLVGDGSTIEEVIRAKEPRFRGFDLIMTNPPFAGDVGNEFSGTYDLAKDRRAERDVLFLERCVELLRPGGRLAIVLPHNKVGGEHWSHVRSWLLSRARVVAVVGLGRNTFMPHTSQKACVLIAVRRVHILESVPRSEKVLFFVSEREGKDTRGHILYDSTGGVDHDLGEATHVVRAALSDLEQVEA